MLLIISDLACQNSKHSHLFSQHTEQRHLSTERLRSCPGTRRQRRHCHVRRQRDRRQQHDPTIQGHDRVAGDAATAAATMSSHCRPSAEHAAQPAAAAAAAL